MQVKSMNYFPYIALGIVAVLGYWYINNLTMSIRELESRNSLLKSEVKAAAESLESIRRSYIELNRVVKQYNASANSMRESLVQLQVKLSKNENRINELAREHPKMIEKAVNNEVQKRMACLVAASRGQKRVSINGSVEKCD